MKKAVLQGTAIGLLACALSATLPGQTDPALILSGKSLGLLRLGASRTDAETLFPLKKNVDLDVSHDWPGCGPITELNWVDFNGNRSQWGNVLIYLRGDKVFQIQTSLPRLHTREGIKGGSSPDLVKKHYASLDAYALRSSGGQMFDFHDFIYWVGSEEGIAFELAYDRRTGGRFVYKIIVFEPKTIFLPEGCIYPPQEWKKLAPYSLDDP